MSTKTGKKPGAGLYLLPLAMAVPIIAGTIFAFARFWPHAQKLLNILIKLVVKA